MMRTRPPADRSRLVSKNYPIVEVTTVHIPMDLHHSGDQHIMQEEPLLSGSSSKFLGAQPLIVKEVMFNQKTLGSN